MPPTSETLSAAEKRILIVEDEQVLNQSLARKFEKQGFAVTTCFDGQQAIDHLANDTFDCMLLDLMMPVKDGFAVLTALPNTPNADMPAYVLTTLGQDDKLAEARKLGAKETFLKSEISPRDVVAKIRRDVMGE